MRRRQLLVLGCVGCVGLLGCAHRRARALRTPRGLGIYVAPFVDETRAGEAALAVTRALTELLWELAPERYRDSLAEDAAAVDGTIISHTVAGGRVAVEARGRLVFRGATLAELAPARVEQGSLASCAERIAEHFLVEIDAAAARAAPES